MNEYAALLERRRQFGGDSGFEPTWFPDKIFPFQRALVEWACRKGRAALFEGVGLGKSIQELTWAQNVIERTNKPVLLLTPLAVGPQMVREGKKFGVDTKRSRDGTVPKKPCVVVANYQRLHLFNAGDFAGVVCDESGILKNVDGETRKAVTEFMLKTPYRLLATATPSPNDFIELGTSSEALGYLGHADMMTKFFKKVNGAARMSRSQENRGENWRFRGHAEKDFWRWVTSWARAVRKPSDLGFPDTGYILPPLTMRQHMVDVKELAEGMLFALPAVGLREQRGERKRSIAERCEKAASLTLDHECSISWCHLNPEGDLLEELIPDCVQVKGSQSDDEKEELIEAFVSRQAKRLVSKPTITGYGLNLQFCAHQTWFPSHSYEQFHQGMGRSHRFGQKSPVTIDMITSEGEADVLRNLERKRDQAEKLFERLVALMNDSLTVRETRDHNSETRLPAWLQ
jgi:hypothetical protein